MLIIYIFLWYLLLWIDIILSILTKHATSVHINSRYKKIVGVTDNAVPVNIFSLVSGANAFLVLLFFLLEVNVSSRTLLGGLTCRLRTMTSRF